MPFPTGSRSSKLSRGKVDKSVEEVCVICFKAVNGDVLSSQFLGHSDSKRIFNACCRMLNIDELQKSPYLENFAKDNIPFCSECLTNMKILSELFAQLDCIEKSIDKIRLETKIKILLSHEKGKGCRNISIKNNKRGCGSLRHNYFRKQAIKEFDPIVNLKRLEVPTDKLETIKEWRNTDNKNFEPDVHCFNQLLEEAEDGEMIKIENEVEELDIDYFEDFSTFQDLSKEPESPVENAQTTIFNDIYVGNSIVESVKQRKRKTRTKIVADYDENDDLNSDPEYFGAEDYTRDSSVTEQDYETRDSSATEQEYDTRDSSVKKTDIIDSSHLLLIGDTEMYYEGFAYSISKSGYCQCKTCSMYCMNKRRIQVHIRDVHLKGTETDKGVHDKDNTENTSENKVGSDNSAPNSPHTCPICAKVFKNAYLLLRHTRRGHAVKRKAPYVKKQYVQKYLTSLLGDGRFSYRGTTFCTLEEAGCAPKYKCETCQKIFPGRPHIHQHITNIHFAKRKKECETDEQILAGTDSGVYFKNLSIHLGGGKWSYRNFEYTLDTSTKKLRCTTCSKLFDKVYNMQYHIKNVHAQPINRYTRDGKILTKAGTPKVRFAEFAIDLGEGKKSFKGFEYSVIEEFKKFQCGTCSKFYPSQSSVQQHIKVVHVTNINLEKYTTMGTERKVGLPAIHLGVGVHSFKGVEFRIEVNPVIEDATKYIIHCSVCGKTFPSCWQVRSHIFWLHAPEEDGHRCKVCQKRFYHPGGLQRHEQTHVDQRNHICEQCGLAFKFATTLTDHIKRVHVKLRPFQCEYCGKQFYTRKDCRVHAVSHTKIKVKD